MSNEEKYSEVYSTARALQVNIFMLHKKSRNVLFWQIVTLILPAMFFFLTFFVVNKYFLIKVETSQSISFIVFYIVFMLCYFYAIRSYYNLKMFYGDVKKQCGELSDMVDWETMRKRQVYKTLDPLIQRPIDLFYEFSRSKQCPFYGGAKRYNFLRLMSIVEVVLVLSISFLYTFGIIDI